VFYQTTWHPSPAPSLITPQPLLSMPIRGRLSLEGTMPHCLRSRS
jgi:hypothetical protein